MSLLMVPIRTGSVLHPVMIALTIVQLIEPAVFVTSEPVPGAHTIEFVMFDRYRKCAPSPAHCENVSAPGDVGVVGIVVDVGVPAAPPHVGRGVTALSVAVKLA